MRMWNRLMSVPHLRRGTMKRALFAAFTIMALAFTSISSSAGPAPQKKSKKSRLESRPRAEGEARDLAERRSLAEGGLPRAFQLQLAALPLRPAARPVDSHHRQSREAGLERRGG